MKVLCTSFTLAVMNEEYLNQAQIAEARKVSRSAITNYLRRYAGSERPFPEPDIEQPGGRGGALWKRDRLPEILAWNPPGPGRGAGGGRPRKNNPANPSS